MVKVPHALSASAFDDRDAQAGERDHDDEEDRDRAVTPATGPISARAISASDRPPRRTDAQRMTKSCTAPARQTPADEPDEAGGIAELRREHRTDERAGAGDRGEVMAEEHPGGASGDSCVRRSARAPA